jgi:hypothetical protein
VELNVQCWEWSFILADVQFPILGIYFLCHHKLPVDVVDNKLLPKSAVSTAVAVTAPVTVT